MKHIYRFLIIPAIMVACSQAAPSPSQAADAAYGADLLSCVDAAKYPTRRESDFCVTTTKKRWSRP